MQKSKNQKKKKKSIKKNNLRPRVSPTCEEKEEEEGLEILH